MRSLLLMSLTLQAAFSLVDFTNSALYDIYDFIGVHEVHIAKCDNGCLIFAATMGESFPQYPENLDPFAMNIYVCDNNEGKNISIPHLAQQRDDKNRKIPLTINGQGNISVINLNDPNDRQFWTSMLYVIEKAKAEQFSYEVYDYNDSENMKIVPQSDIVTIMSAYPFRITAQPTTQPNSVTARLVGLDNALDNNEDGCPYAYKTPDSPSFPGFSVILTPQIVSLAIEKKNPIELLIDYKFNSVRDLATDGFIASPGWNGCPKPNSGGFQSFHAREALDTDVYTLASSENDYDVNLYVLPNFDASHALSIDPRLANEKPVIVTGTLPRTLNFKSTHYVQIFFEDMKRDQGFLMRYVSTVAEKSTTISSTEASSPQTTPTLTPPTTSSAIREIGYVFSLMLLLRFLN